MRACNKQLLGKLYADQLYLERLLVNPHFLNGRQNILALEQQLTKKKGDREGKYKDKESDPKDQEDPIQRKVFCPKLFPISQKCIYVMVYLGKKLSCFYSFLDSRVCSRRFGVSK